MTKLKLCTIIIMLLALAPGVAGQLVYDEVKIKVSPGTTCPATWTASEETITIEALYVVTVPASIGGRSIRVSLAFVDLIWPSADNKVGGGSVGGAGDPSWLGLDDQLLLPYSHDDMEQVEEQVVTGARRPPGARRHRIRSSPGRSRSSRSRSRGAAPSCREETVDVVVPGHVASHGGGPL